MVFWIYNGKGLKEEETLQEAYEVQGVREGEETGGLGEQHAGKGGGGP